MYLYLTLVVGYIVSGYLGALSEDLGIVVQLSSLVTLYGVYHLLRDKHVNDIAALGSLLNVQNDKIRQLEYGRVDLHDSTGRKVFIVGTTEDGGGTAAWKFEGVFSSLENALKVVEIKGDSAFVGTAVVDSLDALEDRPWPNAYYPLLEDKPDGFDG